jgi:hypothetical protein
VTKSKDPKEPDFGEHLFEVRHPHGVKKTDDVGERMAEGTIRALTGDDDGDFEDSDTMSEGDLGGPFVETSASEEFGYDDDGMPADTERSALPSAQGDEPRTPDDELDDDEE